MKVKIKVIAGLLLLTGSWSFAQINDYNFQREIKGVTKQWHKIEVPDEVFGKVSQNLSDIRIFGLTKYSDTIEVPYLLRLTSDNITNNEVAFKRVNDAYNENGYYVTFEIPTTQPINQIKLNFRQKNFDWQINLEGSNDQIEWFTISENYRILSIQNELTNFQFTTLRFPSSKYRFFRLRIKSAEKPELQLASINQHKIKKGNFRNYTIKKYDITNIKETKQSEIAVEFKMPVPISFLELDINDTFDYYRPTTIKYLADSINTEQGWKYNYRTWVSGTLNSMEPNEFKLPVKTVHKLKIIIDNHDNQALTIHAIKAKGYVHELIARFTESGTYFLTYGNSAVSKPEYDINRFESKVPDTLSILELGHEKTIKKEPEFAKEPLFQNKIWLWLILATIIILLGWFTLKMIRKQ